MNISFFNERTKSGKKVAKNLLANDPYYADFTQRDHYDAKSIQSSRCSLLGDNLAFAHGAMANDVIGPKATWGDGTEVGLSFANNAFQLLFMEKVVKNTNPNQYSCYKPVGPVEKEKATIQKLYKQLQDLLNA
jgi:hypothetical protein